MNTALAVDPELPRRRLRVDEYRRMGEVGILSADDRVELIDGEILEMAPVGDSHVELVIVLTGRLGAAVGARAGVSVQNPVKLGDHTEPLPDIAVLKPDRRRGVPSASDVLLLIEIADSSLAYDRDTKIPRFARSGIAETWLIDVAGETLTRYRNPAGDAYRDRDVPDLSRPLVLHALADVEIDLAGLFPDDTQGK